MKSAVAVFLRVLGWTVTLVGGVVILGALTGLYVLLIKGVPPGEPLFLDAVVPPLRGALVHLANGVVLACTPFVLRWGARRWRRQSLNEDGPPAV